MPQERNFYRVYFYDQRRRRRRRARLLGLQRRLTGRSQVKARRGVPQLQAAQSGQKRDGRMTVALWGRRRLMRRLSSAKV
jgi:hypothetical protein